MADQHGGYSSPADELAAALASLQGQATVAHKLGAEIDEVQAKALNVQQAFDRTLHVHQLVKDTFGELLSAVFKARSTSRGLIADIDREAAALQQQVAGADQPAAVQSPASELPPTAAGAALAPPASDQPAAEES
jgi:hypothetical protein